MGKRRLGRWAAPGLALAIAALSDCREPTEITLDIETDADCADITETSVNVGRRHRIESEPAATTTDRCQQGTGRIGSIVVVPSGDKSEEITIRIVTGVNKTAQRCIDEGFTGGCIVARRTLNYVPHTPLVLPIEMSLECLDIPCEDTYTCFKGKCVIAKIADPEQCSTPGGCSGQTDAGADDAIVDQSVDQASGGSAGTGGSGGTSGAAGASGGAAGVGEAGADAAPCAANLDTDALNCGACGHSCLGGTCAAGKCQPITLFTTPDPSRVAVDATDVYVVDTEGGLVLKAPNQGGPATPLATGQAYPRYIAVDSSQIYWANYGDNTLMKTAKSGGTPKSIATVKVPFGFVILGSTIYVASYTSNGALYSVPTAGGTPVPLVTGESWVQSVDTDGAFLYWSAVANNTTLRKAPISGGTASAIGPTFSMAEAVKVDSTYAYVLFYGNGQGNGEVRRIALGDGQYLTLATGVNGPIDLAIDSTHAYFTESTGKRVRRVRIDGSAPPELLHTSSGEPWGITLDASAVYWTDTEEGVLKLAK